MLKDALRSIFGKPPLAESGNRAPAAPSIVEKPAPLAPPSVRQSPGLDQFFQSLDGAPTRRILDLSGASQANLNILMEFGHRLYCEDFVATMERVFGDGPEFYTRQADPGEMERFLEQTFAALDGPFDGALLWDTLQFLDPPLLDHAVGHLYRLMEPGALLWTFFSSDDKAARLPINSYRIENAKAYRVIPRTNRPARPVHSSRSIERMFSDFSSVKFFLTRDHFREVLVRR
ncbi:MAG: hypothetical protein SFV18_22225 [Bryobacteraceae bacterium]|jgi:hypothetical protein|nr:hypothetical protein [Bryobacteraceae bacterium]